MAKNIVPLYQLLESGSTMLGLLVGGIAKQEMQVLKAFLKARNHVFRAILIKRKARLYGS